MGYKDLDRKRAYEREWYKKNRHLWQARRTRQRQALRELIADKKRGPCCDCGGSFPSVCMDFHHRGDEEKLFEIGRATRMMYSPDRVLAEIAKCDLLCSNCHRLRSFSGRQD